MRPNAGTAMLLRGANRVRNVAKFMVTVRARRSGGCAGTSGAGARGPPSAAERGAQGQAEGDEQSRRDGESARRFAWAGLKTVCC